MFRRYAEDLSARAEGVLRTCRQAVNAEEGRRARARVARAKFRAKTAGVSWREIRKKLEKAKPVGTTCHYCELDRYRDIDHVYPLAIYPEESFSYLNFVYSCVICNQNRKRERCAAIVDGEVIDLDLFARHNIELPEGVKAFVNPRIEDPANFFDLDLETGIILVAYGADDVSSMRAEYTIAVLHLNDPNLARDRRSSFKLYSSLLNAMKESIRDNDSVKFERTFEDFLMVGRPTVLAKMHQSIGDLGAIGETFNFVLAECNVSLDELLLA